ncbi:MAG: beta-galactosidase [Armatimonadota bacterium]
MKDPPPWTAARTRKLIVEAARLLCRGVFVGEAGTEEFHYEPGENVTFGAKLCNFGREAVQFDVRADILPDGEAEPALRRRRSLRCEPGETATVEFVWERPGPTDSVFQVRVSVSADGRRLDEVRHEFEIGMPPTKTKGFVTVRDGDFRVGDRKWYPFGVNYRPSYVIGEPTLAWAGPYYDPHWVEEELATMESLGMNMLSITSFNEDWRDLRDLLRRCGDHGIRVNLFIPGADPMRFDEDLVRQHIRDARLAENPALFAYDIAWEPRLGRFEQRSRWDGEWGEWIVERYGSIESAEKDWGFPVPRTADGEVTGPSDAQLTVDGDHRRMVAAYRRFADDLISKRYNRATRFIRSLDPNHLISTRSGYGGTGPCYPAVMAFDMISMAKHFDFASPEGWGMTGDRDTILQSGITTAYGRFVTRGKPVMWSEFGMQKWDRSNRRPDPDRVEQEAEYYDDMYNMMLKSGAHGAVPWWWPGGFRVGENSDYGISDPNSGERPVWKTIRKYARLFARPRRLREPDTWITIDRDAHVGGYHDVYVQHKDEYGRLLKEGHFPGLRTEGTGTTSANAPLVAVGDVPYNGSNPPKYLNAEFNWVKVKVGEGEWREVEDGGEIRVPKGAKVMLSASVGNTGEASWLAGEGKGRVYLVSATGSTVDVRQPILADVPYLGDAEVRAFSLALPPGGDARLVLEMDAQGRMRFGEKFELVVRRG